MSTIEKTQNFGTSVRDLGFGDFETYEGETLNGKRNGHGKLTITFEIDPNDTDDYEDYTQQIEGTWTNGFLNLLDVTFKRFDKNGRLFSSFQGEISNKKINNLDNDVFVEQNGKLIFYYINGNVEEIDM